jgi:hypothetical protein
MRSRTTLGMCLFVFFVYLASSVSAAGADCSAFAAAPWTGVPYAYMTPNIALDFAEAKSNCSNMGIVGSQLAIMRNRETTLFVWSNITLPVTYLTSGVTIGLEKIGSTWKWLDGKVCDGEDPNDERCFNSTLFDGSGDFGSFYNDDPYNDLVLFDDNNYFPQGFLCEAPRKLL